MIVLSPRDAVTKCRPSVCLFVCLSHAGIRSKRLNVSSNSFHHRVAMLVFPYQTVWQSDGYP